MIYVVAWITLACATWLVINFPIIGVPTVLILAWKFFYRSDRASGYPKLVYPANEDEEG